MVRQFAEELAQGRVAAALTTTMKGAPLFSDGLSALPRWLLIAMTQRMLNYRVNANYQSFGTLAPTLLHDGQIITRMSGQQESLNMIQSKVLLLGGSKSTTFLKQGLNSIAAALPTAQRIELAGLNHGSAWNREVRGNPFSIAQALRQFYQE
jgi:hypothetical protein